MGWFATWTFIAQPLADTGKPADEANRSRFIAEAVRHELKRRRYHPQVRNLVNNWFRS